MKKKVYISHGWGTKGETQWLFWLKQKLERRGIEAIIQELPRQELDNKEWLAELQYKSGIGEEDTYFVRHNFGCLTLARYIERMLDITQHRTLLVAGMLPMRSVPALPGSKMLIRHGGAADNHSRMKGNAALPQLLVVVEKVVEGLEGEDGRPLLSRKVIPADQSYFKRTLRWIAGR